MISIYIPVTDCKKRNKPHLEGLLDSILAGGYDIPIIVGHDATEIDFVEYFDNKYPMFTHLYHDSNPLKFTKNCNRGIKFIMENSPGGVILLNQDCVVPPWESLKRIENKGISSACSLDLWPGPSYTKEDYELLLEAQPGEVSFTPIGNFAFYCTFISKEVFDKVGYLDGLFHTVFSDDQYCIRTHLAGFPVEATNIPIVHYGTHRGAETGESGSGSYDLEELGEFLPILCTQWQCNKPHAELIPWVLENHVWNDSMRVDR